MLSTDSFFAIASELAFTACSIIRQAAELGDINITMKSENNPVTETDLKIQTLVVRGLRTIWPTLRIVGEEAKDFEGQLNFSFDSLFHKTNVFESILHGNKKTSALQLSKVCAWVDPLDGTNGFCSGNLDEVTVLIGLSCQGRARLGIIGIPYAKDEHNNLVFNPKVYFGDSEQGCLFEMSATGIVSQVSPILSSTEIKVIGSKHLSPKLDETLAMISSQVASMGGCGNKFVHVLQSKFNTIINLSNKSSRWDTCAGHALVSAMGGVVCTLRGTQILYDENGCHTNCQGFVCVMNREHLQQIFEITQQFVIQE